MAENSRSEIRRLLLRAVDGIDAAQLQAFDDGKLVTIVVGQGHFLCVKLIDPKDSDVRNRLARAVRSIDQWFIDEFTQRRGRLVVTIDPSYGVSVTWYATRTDTKDVKLRGHVLDGTKGPRDEDRVDS